MSTTYAPDVTDRFTQHFIRKTARRLIAEEVFPASESDDLIQDLTVGLLERLSSFDPGKAKWSTFVKTAIKSVAISLIRRQRTERRGGGQTVSSLNVMLHDEDGNLVELGDTITEQEYLSGFGYELDTPLETAIRDMDVETAIAGLDDELQTICRQLMRKPLSAVAKELGVTPSTLDYQVKKLREHFAKAGFGPA